MQKQRYVIIRGQVFRWEEKEPFVPSGKSVLGALEYDRERELLKCHDCGEWFSGLDRHVRRVHADVRNYKITHGLRMGTGLTTPALKRARAARLPTNPIRRTKGCAAPKITRRSGKDSAEYQNQTGKCPAQTIFKIQSLASVLGRAPIKEEAGWKLAKASVARFGSWNKALAAAGLTPNQIYRSREQLRESLIDFYVLNRKLPSSSDWGSGRLADRSVFAHHFGSLVAAYRDAGLAVVYAEERRNRALYASSIAKSLVHTQICAD